jgi:hypothetical protein
MVKKPALVFIVALAAVSCGSGGGGYDSGGGAPAASGGSGAPTSCPTGQCLQNAFCCPQATPFYSSGGPYSTAGCYASCPYPGDCGSGAPQCF